MLSTTNYRFIHDDVDVLVPAHKHSNTFVSRAIHEIKFRKINRIFIENNIITNNIIDSGAWIGDNSIPWAKMSSNIVYAIDPSQENCEYIKLVASVNNLNNIIIIHGALTDEPKIISTDWDWYHCSFINGIGGKNSIEATSIDQLYDNKIIDNIGYIHLDVEGMEHLVIKGASRTISRFYPIITFEQHLNTDKYNDLCSTLKDGYGYRTLMVDEILPGCLPDCRNFLAIPNRLDILYIKNMINTILAEQILLDVIL